MAAFGFIILLLAFVLCFYTVVMAAGAGFGKKTQLFQSARFGSFALAALVSVASFALIYSFITHDFSIRYVSGYSGKAVPSFYLVLALWGGMEGSLLFWAWLLSLFLALAVWQNRARNRDLMPHVIFITGLILLFFLSVLLFSSNPFLEHPGGVIPPDGRGLNPLLQTPAMAIHPPALYLGFVACAIPFAFAIGALITKRLDEGWIKTTRRWAIVAWIFLTLGNLLGANWAYTELGWGGAWGWDPVENAAIMPWFTMTAYLHSVMIQERRGMLKVWNMSLIILTFVMTIFGTFLTRSGVISSVHSFAQSDVGMYFLVFLGVIIMGSFGLLFARLRYLRTEHHLDAMLSREFMFLLNNLLLLGAMLAILVGTMYPKISELFLEKPISIAAPWFNQVLTPIGLLLLALTGIGPLIPWRRATPKNLIHQFLWPLAVGLATLVAVLAFGMRDVYGIIFFVLCAFVTWTVIQEIYRGTLIRRKNSKENPLLALVNLVSRARRRYGGYIVHIGVVFIFFALAGGLFASEDKHEFKRGETVEFAGWNMQYLGLRSQLDDDALDSPQAMGRYQKNNWHTIRHLALMKVTAGGKHVATLTPGRFVYRTHPQQPTTEVDTLTTATGDLYLVLHSFDRKGTTATIKAYYNPLMFWMWLGGGTMLLGALIAIWPEPRKRVRSSARAPAPAMASTITRAVWVLALAAAAGGLVLAAATAEASPRERRGEVSRYAPVRAIAGKLMCPCPTCNWAKLLASCGCGGAEAEIARIEADVKAGIPKKEIIDKRVKKYGWRILAIPPDMPGTRAAWILPYVAMIAGAAGIGLLGIGWVRRRRRRETPAPGEAAGSGEKPKDDAYEKRLDDELRRLD